MIEVEELVVPADCDDAPLPGLLRVPRDPVALLVFAHGAGAGMRHRFMAGLADALWAERVATLLWEFPYMAAGKRRPDRPAAAVRSVRRAAAFGRALRDERCDRARLLAGGKSFGGRMTSTAASDGALPVVEGVVLVGFPLHAVGRPSTERGQHLSAVDLPVLVVQGTRDKMGSIADIEPLMRGLRPGSRLHVEDDADHGFHVRKRSGRTDEEVVASVAAAVAGWAGSLP